MTDRKAEAPQPAPTPITLAPLDIGGIGAAVVGTALWLIGLALCLICRDQLTAHGNAWWISVCLVGIALGVLGLGFALARRRWPSARD